MHRIGVYTPWDTSDPSAWSGMVAPMVRALQDDLEVEVLPRVTVPDAPSERVRAGLRGRLGHPSLPRHTRATARRRSAALRHVLDERSGPPLDALVAIAASTDVLDLPERLPLVQVTDATFPAITGFYPLATGLGARNEQEGLRVELAGATVTDRYAVATDWAARSLVDVVHVAPERITVVPFGPGVPPGADARPRKPEGALRVLAVIADWERKRGDDVLEAIRRARQAAPIELTLVGAAPTSLPDWVHATGTVDRSRLSTLYAEHHVLLDLARANAAGVVLTDALASGLPVVATNVGGVGTIVRDGATGWLVDPAEAPTEAARTLASLTPGAVTTASRTAISDAQERLNWAAWAAGVRDAVAGAVIDRAGRSDSRRRIAMLSPVLPSAAGHESAGERLVHDVLQVLAEDADVTVVTRDGPSTRRALDRGGAPDHVLLPATPPATEALETSGRGFRDRAASGLDRLGRALRMVPVVRPSEIPALDDVLGPADVLDLQWEENGLLLPALRRRHARARLVVTLHDVVSQRCARQRDLQTGPARRSVWEARRLAAVALERLIVGIADDVVVLSRKDADLLPRIGRRARVHVVPPAIHGKMRPARSLTSDAAPLLLFVGFMARWENEDAAHWLVTEILPLVQAELPAVRMAVAGGGLRDHVVTELETAGVEVLGFVDDLEPLYAEAAAVLVPLRYGAGVKFKVVDALVRGVPVVTTSVGNEGIEPQDAALVHDDAPAFAEAVVRVLRDRPAAETHVRDRAAAVAAEFGQDAFRARLMEVYA